MEKNILSNEFPILIQPFSNEIRGKARHEFLFGGLFAWLGFQSVFSNILVYLLFVIQYIALYPHQIEQKK